MDRIGQMLCVAQSIRRHGWGITPLVRAGSEVRFLLAAPALSSQLRDFLTRNFSVALVERWFCNPQSFPIKSTGNRGKSRVPRRSGCEIAAPSERSAARKSAQSISSVIAPPGETDD